MDKPKCRLCGGRHWASEPHKIEPDMLHTPLPESYPITPREKVVPLPVKADGAGLIAPAGECPYCDRRRARTSEKVRAWRAAKKEQP